MINPIIYIDGSVADDLGAVELKRLANEISDLVRRPVEIMTHGASKFHADRRTTGTLTGPLMANDKTIVRDENGFGVPR